MNIDTSPDKVNRQLCCFLSPSSLKQVGSLLHTSFLISSHKQSQRAINPYVYQVPTSIQLPYTTQVDSRQTTLLPSPLRPNSCMDNAARAKAEAMDAHIVSPGDIVDTKYYGGYVQRAMGSVFL